MSNPLDVNAAPREITLAGRKYRITPLRRRELAEFVAWVQDTEFAAVRRQTAAMVTDTQRQAGAMGSDEDKAALARAAADRQAVLEAAIARTAGYSMAHPAVMRRMTTAEGSAKLLWLGLRHEHPDLTEDDLFDLLMADGGDERAMVEAMEAIDVATGGGPGSKRPSKKKTPARRKKRSR